MEAHEVAEQLLTIVQHDIDHLGDARYNNVRAELELRVGERAIVYKGGHTNIAPDVLQEFKKLPGWERLSWQASRQRWVAAEKSNA